MFELTIFHIGSDNGLAQTREQAIISTNDGLVYRCINVSLSLNDLSHLTMSQRHIFYTLQVLPIKRSVAFTPVIQTQTQTKFIQHK